MNQNNAGKTAMRRLGYERLLAVHSAVFNAVYCITNSPAERTGLYRTAARAHATVTAGPARTDLGCEAAIKHTSP
jgi:hypothetical protein